MWIKLNLVRFYDYSEIFNKVSPGKYTNGLGQLQLAFTYPFEDVNSLCLTGNIYNLIQSSPDYSKITTLKPHKLEDFKSEQKRLLINPNPPKLCWWISSKITTISKVKPYFINLGATSINACYGATNALINTLNWITSPSWDGRYGIVVASDLAVYEKGPARCTGGAGAIAMLIGPKAKVSFNK